MMLLGLLCILAASAVLNWLSVRATWRTLTAPKHAHVLARACEPLDLILDTAIIAPHSMAIPEMLFLVRESRDVLTLAGAQPYRSPDPAKILRASAESEELPGGDTEESRAARQSLTSDPRFAGLVIGRDAFVHGLDPRDDPWTSDHALSFAILMMLDALMRAVYRARFQGPPAADRLAQTVVECGVMLERGA